MIIDVITLFNETDVIDLRFEVLGDLVDEFIIVEMDQTFTGKSKPTFMSWDRWPKWNHKIRLVGSQFPRKDMTSWEREIFTRNLIGDIDTTACDYILVSDADEIPNPDTVRRLVEEGVDEPVRLDVDQYFWNFNWQVPKHMNKGGRPVLMPQKLEPIGPKERRYFTTAPQRSFRRPWEAHEVRGQVENNYRTEPNGGWHFSFLGSNEAIRAKIEAFSHTEYDSEEYKDALAIQDRVLNGVDPFDRFPLKYTPISYETHPRWVVDHQEEVKHLTVPPPY